MNLFMHSSSEEERGTPKAIAKLEPEMFYEKKKMMKKKKLKKKEQEDPLEKQRMSKINHSYYALFSLLIDDHSKTLKRRCSAPKVANSVVHRIRELQKEVEKLKQKRDTLLALNHKKDAAVKTAVHPTPTPTVSVTEDDKGDVTVQIILHYHLGSDRLSTLLASIEQEGVSITSSSSLLLCNQTLSYSLHLHVNKSFHKEHYDQVLRKKVVSWWCENISSNLELNVAY